MTTGGLARGYSGGATGDEASRRRPSAGRAALAALAGGALGAALLVAAFAWVVVGGSARAPAGSPAPAGIATGGEAPGATR